VHAYRRGRNLHAHSLQEVRQRLRREHRLLAVARAAQADNDAVAQKRIVADAFDRGDILDLDSARFFVRAGTRQGRESQNGEQNHNMLGQHKNSSQKVKSLSTVRTSMFGRAEASATEPLPLISSSRLVMALDTTELFGAISPGRTKPRRTTV